MSLARNILSNAGATAVSSVVQLVLVLSLARWLDVEGFAIYITAVAIVGFGEMASDFGVRIWGTRQFAIRNEVDGILGAALMTKAVFSLLLIMLTLLLPFQLLNVTEALLAALVACSQPSTDPLLWYMRGKERLDIEAAVTLGWRIGNALFIASAAWYGMSVSVLLGIWLASNLLRILVEWKLPLLRELRSARLLENSRVRELIANVISQSFPVGTAFLIMAVYQRLGVLLLGVLAVPETVAHFGAAFTLVASAGFVATSITVASFPKLARAVESKNRDEVCRIVEQKLLWIAAVFFPGCLLGMFLSSWMVGLLYPPAYAEAAIAMMALLPGLYISSINFALKYLMNAIHKNWMDVFSVLAGMLTFVGFLLMAEQGELLKQAGVAWGVGEMAIFFVKLTAIKRDAMLSGIRLLPHLLLFLILFGIMFKTIGAFGD